MIKQFIQRITSAFTKSSESFSIPIDGLFGYSSTSSTAIYSNWVYVCIDKIAEVISKTNFHLMRVKANGDIEELDDHPFLDIFHKPNESQTLRDMLYVIISWLELEGNAYIYRENDRNETRLHVLNSNAMRHEYNSSHTRVTRYIYNTKSGEKRYLPEQIVHLKYPNPFDPTTGCGTVDRIKQWVNIDVLSVQFSSFMFKNGSVLGGVIETETNDAEKLREIASSFEERYTGVDKNGKTPVFPKGVKYNPLASSPKEMQVSESEKANVDRILKAFGVSRGILGEVDGSGRANVEMEQYMFASQTIEPKLERLVEYLNEFLIKSLFPNDNIYLSYDSPVPADKQFELEQLRASIGDRGWRTVNEVRGEQGLEPVDGGDELAGSYPMFQLSAKNEKAIKSNKLIPQRIKAKNARIKRLNDKAEEVADELTEAFLDSTHKAFISRVAIHENDLINKVIEYDVEYAKKVKKRIAGKKSMTKAEVEDVFSVDEYQIGLSAVMSPILAEIVAEEGKAQFNLVPNPVTTEFDEKDKRILQAVGNAAKLRNNLFATTTEKLLAKEIKEALENGETAREIEKRVDNITEMTMNYRGKRLGQDVAFSTANEAVEGAYRQTGVVRTKRWHTTEDEVVCPYCAHMNGKTVGIEENYFKKGDQLIVPNAGALEIKIDDVRHPPIHPGCRCFILPADINI